MSDLGDLLHPKVTQEAFAEYSKAVIEAFGLLEGRIIALEQEVKRLREKQEENALNPSPDNSDT